MMGNHVSVIAKVIVNKSILITLLCLLYSAAAVAGVVKWVDENGKVHYGDRVPEKYKDQAEQVEMDNMSVVGQEAETKDANRQYTQKLKQQDYREQQQQKRELEKQRKAAKKKKKPTLTREMCRNWYPTLVKKRTECFQKVESSNQ